MFSKSLNILTFLSKYIAILFLLLVAVYVLVARVTLHFLPDYKGEVLRLLNEGSSQTIDIMSITSYWEGFDPVLQLNGLKVGTKDPIYISKINLYFSFLQSISSLKPKFKRILIEQTNLSVRQSDLGDWEFLGLSTEHLTETQAPVESAEEGVLTFLAFFNGTTLNIKDLNATISNESGMVRTLRLPKLNVNYEDDRLFVSGQILENLGDMTLLNFSLNGRGLLSPEPIKGTLFLEARSDQFFGELLSVYDWQKVRIQDIEGSVRTWINFEGFDIASIYGDLLVSEINWQAGQTNLPPINNLAFSFLYQDSPTAKNLSITNLGFEWSKLSCDPVALNLNYTAEKLTIQSDRLNIQCANDIALALEVLPFDLQQRLMTSSPTGYLENLSLIVEAEKVNPDSENASAAISDDLPVAHVIPEESLELAQQLNSGIPINESVDLNRMAENPSQVNNDAEQSQRFVFESMLVDVNIQAYESTPSIKGLNGYLYADKYSGYVSFLSDNFELGFPTLFIDPWALKKAEGLVSWHVEPDEVTVHSEGLRLRREDDSLIYGDFILRINNELAEDYLALSLGMQDIAIQDAVKFVPYYSVNEGLYSWLSQSLVGGKVSSGVYYGYGSVDEIDALNSFTSSVYLETNNGVVQFDQAWPFLESLDSNIILQNGQLDITASRAVIADTPLNNLVAYLPEVNDGLANHISISAESSLSSELVNYWLTASPISKHTSNIVEQLSINSSAYTDIKLKIPVAENETTKKEETIDYLVNTTLMDGELVHLPTQLKFSNVFGMISVDSQKGVNAKKIDTVFNKHPAVATISTSFNKGKAKPGEKPKTSQNTKITMDGILGLQELFAYFGKKQPKPLAGEFIYQAELNIPDEENKYPMLSLKSNLIGVACDCPTPFKKALNQQSELNLSVLLKPEQSYLDAKIRSKNRPSIDTELLFNNNSLTFGEVLIGGAKVKSTDIKGINIAARLEDAHVENWLSFIKQFEETSAAEEEPTALRKIQISVANLNAFDHVFKNSEISILPKYKLWDIEVKSKEAQGKIRYAESEDISLNFEKLNLVPLKSQSSPTHKQTELDPREFPRLYFKAKNLLLEGRNIGSWQFDIAPNASGSVFRNIKGNVKGSNINGQLNWLYSSQSQSTIATFTASGVDISSLFEAFDFPTLMTSNRFQSDFAFVWPDSPLNFSPEFLSGNISLNLEDGFLKTEDQKTGVLRLFGVLNAESIKRRLKLDFSDLYKSGVGYDTFNAKAVMDQGLLTLTEPLVIDGPGGKYVLNGRSDLATKALDIDMLVELPFSQNVPLAALVLGAPQIGGLVWVADKLLGEPLSALTTSRYDITGTWEEPRVDLKQAINASKKDRSKEKGVRDAGKQKKK